MNNSVFSVPLESARADHPLARLHPATQLLAAVLLGLGVVLVPSVDHFRRLAPLAVVLLVGLALSRTRPREFLRGLKYLAFFLALVFLWPLVSYADKARAVQEGAFSASKIVLLYATGFLLVRSASRWQIARVLERASFPFARASRMLLLMSLTLALLPEMASSATRLYASYTGRLASGRVYRWVRHAPLLLGAYFARVLARAERLSRGLVARHFCGRLGPGAAGRGSPARWADLACLLLSVAAVVLSWAT